MIAFGVVEPGVAYIDRPSAYGIALRRSRVLVVRTPKGCTLPGGGLDHVCAWLPRNKALRSVECESFAWSIRRAVGHASASREAARRPA